MHTATVLQSGPYVDGLMEFIDDVLAGEPVLLQLLIFGLLLGGVLALVSLGLTMIFGVMEVVNFAHGSFLLVGMYAMFVFAQSLGIQPIIALFLVMGTLTLVGLIVYQTSLRMIIEEAEASQFVVTFGWLLILDSLIPVLFGYDLRQIQVDYGVTQVGGIVIPNGQLFGLAIALASMVIFWLFLQWTEIGRRIRAVSNSRIGAQVVGINVARVDLIAFVLGAALAGLAGGTIALFQNFGPQTGESFLVDSFVVVVLGGLGSFPGAFVGGILIGLVSIFGEYYLPGTTNQILIMLIFIGVLLVKPTGLMGTNS